MHDIAAEVADILAETGNFLILEETSRLMAHIKYIGDSFTPLYCKMQDLETKIFMEFSSVKLIVQVNFCHDLKYLRKNECLFD